MTPPVLRPRALTTTLGAWRSQVARDAAGYLALVGGQALAVDLADGIGLPRKAVRQMLARHPDVFRFSHQKDAPTGKEFLVVVLVLGRPQDLKEATRKHLSLGGNGRFDTKLTHAATV